MIEEFSLDGFQTVHMTTDGILYERRKVLGLTQKQVAEIAKVPFQSYQRFESGERKLETASFKLACRVIEALGMNVSDFYHGKYVLGEPVTESPEGLRYKSTGTLVDAEPSEEN